MSTFATPAQFMIHPPPIWLGRCELSICARLAIKNNQSIELKTIDEAKQAPVMKNSGIEPMTNDSISLDKLENQLFLDFML